MMVFSNPPVDEIATDEVHLWRARGGAIPEPPWLGCLDSGDKQRAMRLIVPAQRKAFTFARAMLRTVLGAYLGVDPGQVRMATTAAGKPHLPGEELQFNLSHSADGVLLAVVRGSDIGVDLESTGRKIDIDAVAAASLSEVERVRNNPISEAERRRTIIRLWTRKEALLKAEGSGLVRDPRDLTLPSGIAPSMPVRVRHGGRIWTLTELLVGDGWQASMAVEGQARTVRGYCLGW